MIFYNYGQLGHFFRDYTNPSTTCSYCKYFDHTVEESAQLIAKWQAKDVGNEHLPQNPILNIQKISTEPRELGIAIMTRGGDAIGVDQEAS